MNRPDGASHDRVVADLARTIDLMRLARLVITERRRNMKEVDGLLADIAATRAAIGRRVLRTSTSVLPAAVANFDDRVGKAERDLLAYYDGQALAVETAVHRLMDAGEQIANGASGVISEAPGAAAQPLNAAAGVLGVADLVSMAAAAIAEPSDVRLGDPFETFLDHVWQQRVSVHLRDSDVPSAADQSRIVAGYGAVPPSWLGSQPIYFAAVAAYERVARSRAEAAVPAKPQPIEPPAPVDQAAATQPLAQKQDAPAKPQPIELPVLVDSRQWRPPAAGVIVAEDGHDHEMTALGTRIR